MEFVTLSERLSALFAMVSKGRVFCDVGCDHGFLSIALVQRGVAERAIAMDLREGPLSAARQHILSYGLSDRIETRLSDGVAALSPGEADTILIAGMGGAVTLHILSEGEEVFRQAKEIILQPQSEIRLVREYLAKKGFVFLSEDMVREDGKFYPMMKVSCHSPGSGIEEPRELSEAEALYGPLLLAARHPVLRLYLEKERGTLTNILSSLPADNTLRRQEVSERLALVEELLKEQEG